MFSQGNHTLNEYFYISTWIEKWQTAASFAPSGVAPVTDFLLGQTSQKYLLSDPCSNDSTFKINMHSLTKAFGTIFYYNNRYSLNDYHAPFSSNDLCSGEKYVAVDLLDQSFLETHHIVDILSQMFEI